MHPLLQPWAVIHAKIPAWTVTKLQNDCNTNPSRSCIDVPKYGHFRAEGGMQSCCGMHPLLITSLPAHAACAFIASLIAFNLQAEAAHGG